MKRRQIRLFGGGGSTSGVGGSTGAREHREMTSQEMIDKLKELAAGNPELAKQLNEAFKPEKKTRQKFDPDSVSGAIDFSKTADFGVTKTTSNGIPYTSANRSKIDSTLKNMTDEQVRASIVKSGYNLRDFGSAKGQKLKDRFASRLETRFSAGNVFRTYDDNTAASKKWGR